MTRKLLWLLPFSALALAQIVPLPPIRGFQYKPPSTAVPLSYTANLDAPATVDSNKANTGFAVNATIYRAQCWTDTGTVTINFDTRTLANPNTPGTNVLSAGLVCGSAPVQTTCASGCTVNTITAGAVTAYTPVNMQITATSGTPNMVHVLVFAQ